MFLKTDFLLAALKQHLAIVVLTCFAIVPLFVGLGDDHLWSDEGDTAVLAGSILKHGVPKAWDGVTFTDADFGDRLNKSLVMISHPWLQYYVTAASFLFFGETEFGARFPFALAGLVTIPLLYILVLRQTSSRRAAFSACVLLTLSVQFLLFSRQCRNYSLNMFLACLMLLLFFRLTNFRTAVWFSVVTILLFHANPAGVAAVGALAGLTLIYPAFRQYRRWFWISMVPFSMFTLPWIMWAQTGYQQNTTFIYSWKVLVPRVTQFFIECASVTPVIGVIALFIWAWVRHFRERPRPAKRTQKPFILRVRQISHEILRDGERALFVVACSIFISYGVLVAVTQSRMEMWNYGLRHVTPIIPLMAAVVGLLVWKVSRANTKLWIAIMLVLTVTKFGRITPWSFLQEERAYLDGSEFAAMHVPKGWVNKIFRTASVSFARELWHDNPGTIAHVCGFLNSNSVPGEVLITNYEWEPIYFHTKLPQGLKIFPTYNIYGTAQKHNLPNYVFSVQDARWIVWRWSWDGYRNYDWSLIAKALIESGATITKVASMPETTWENRANVHFHRYPGDEYKFAFDENEPPTEIFRVDWPIFERAGALRLSSDAKN